MSQGIRLEPSLELKICNDYLSGVSIKTICDLYGISRATVNNVRVKHNVDRRKTLITQDLISKVVEYYKEHLSITKTAKAFRLNQDTVSKILKKLNVHSFWHQYDQRRLVKDNPFIESDSDEAFYFIGLLATDGCVHESGHVSLGLVDKEIITKFCEFLKADLNIYEFIDPRYNNAKPMYSIKFSNRDVANHLSDLGLTPRKTHTLKVNFDINYSFLRGVIDGDGCIKRDSDQSVSVIISTASPAFKDQLISFLENDGFKVCVYESKSLYNIRIGKKAQVLKLYNLLYKDADVYLERKRMIYDYIR